MQSECKKGVKKGNSAVTNSGETPRKALTSLIKPLYSPSDTVPRLHMSPCTLHTTHRQLPILSATSPWRGKLEEQEQGRSGDVRCRNSDGTSTQPVGSGGGGIMAKAAAEDADT